MLDAQHLIDVFGLAGIFAIVFAESGLLFGFFLPGDSLLFTAGLFASQGTLNLPVILVGCFVAAVTGDQVGYAFGNRAGPTLFRRPDSRFFKQQHLAKAQAFFDRYGAKTIVLARFVPIIRTFTPVMAGVGGMDRRTYTVYNVIGALLWAVGVTLLGYVLGDALGDDIDTYLLPIIAVIILVSLIPPFLEWRRARRVRQVPAREAAAGDAAGEGG